MWPFRSDSIDSKTNLVVDVTHHGEPSQREEYQHPKIEMEPVYSNCGMVDCKDNGTSRPDENDGTTGNRYVKSSGASGYQQPRKTSGKNNSEANPPLASSSKDTLLSNQIDQHGKTSIPSEYQHPKPERTYMNMTIQKEASLPPSDSELTSETDQLNEHGEKARWAPSDYQHPRVDQEAKSVIPSEFGETSPTEQVNHSTEASKPGDYQHPRPDTHSTTQLDNKTSLALPPRSKEIPPTEPPTSQMSDHPGLRMKGTNKSNQGTPSKPPRTPLLPRSECKNLRPCPDTDTKFLGGDQHPNYETTAPTTKPSSGEGPPTASKSQPPSPSLDDGNSDREAGYQIPEIDAKFLENEGYNPPQPSRSSGDEKSNRGAGHQVVEMEFLESEDKSFIRPSSSPPPELPTRASEKARPSTASAALTPPALPARIPSQKLPFTRQTKASVGLEPPAVPPKTPSPRIGQTIDPASSSPPTLPPKTPSQKSPPARSLMAATSSPSTPPLPGRKPSVTSPKTVPSKSPSPPPVPPKAAPSLPTKPVSSSPYAELNELDRQDDTADYQHLSPTTKQ